MDKGMDKEKIEEFLKGYADFLQSGFDVAASGPYTTRVHMAAGTATVDDNEGETIAMFSTRGMPCSMPVSSRDVFLSKLLCDLLNSPLWQNGYAPLL